MKNKTEFPIIISEQTEEYERIITDFKRIVINRAKEIIKVYGSMGLDKPFSTEVWKSIVIGERAALERLVSEKNENTAKQMKMFVADMKRLKIINYRTPEIDKILMALSGIRNSLGSPMNSHINDHLTLQDMVVLENGELDIDDEVKQSIKDKLRLVINDQADLDACNLIVGFREQYNAFVDLLKSKGFSYVEDLGGTYLGNFFTTDDDMKIKERLDSVCFLNRISAESKRKRR